MSRGNWHTDTPEGRARLAAVERRREASDDEWEADGFSANEGAVWERPKILALLHAADHIVDAAHGKGPGEGYLEDLTKAIAAYEELRLKMRNT